jgi:hypothetical protein
LVPVIEKSRRICDLSDGHPWFRSSKMFWLQLPYTCPNYDSHSQRLT